MGGCEEEPQTNTRRLPHAGWQSRPVITLSNIPPSSHFGVILFLSPVLSCAFWVDRVRGGAANVFVSALTTAVMKRSDEALNKRYWRQRYALQIHIWQCVVRHIKAKVFLVLMDSHHGNGKILERGSMWNSNDHIYKRNSRNGLCLWWSQHQESY